MLVDNDVGTKERFEIEYDTDIDLKKYLNTFPIIKPINYKED